MGIFPEQYRVRSGYFNDGIVCKQSPKVHFSKNQITLYMDKTTKQIKKDMTKQQDNLGPCHSLLVYVYILLFSLIFSMHIDVTKKRNDYFRYSREHIFLFDKGIPIS